VLRLMQANTGNDAAPLDEVGRLLGELAGAWSSIAKGADRTAATAGA
jgi:flagellin-specific chaperone FliS